MTTAMQMIDTHTHLALKHDDSSDLTIYYRRPMAETLAITRQNAEITLQAGFTTVRNVGDYFPTAITEVRDDRGNQSEITGCHLAGDRTVHFGVLVDDISAHGDVCSHRKAFFYAGCQQAVLAMRMLVL